MVIVTFPNGSNWFKANWAFRQLASDVANRYPDEDVRECLKRAEALGGMDFTRMDHALAARVSGAIRSVAQDTVDGVISGWRPEDRAGAAMYREAMVELLAAIATNYRNSER